MPYTTILALFQFKLSFMELLGDFFVDDGESVELFGDGGGGSSERLPKNDQKNRFLGSKMLRKATNPILAISFL